MRSPTVQPQCQPGALRSRWGGGACPEAAFTLLEVMIAVGIFTMAMLSILTLMTQNLSAARRLNQFEPTGGMVAAELSMTNKLEEGSDSGEFGELYRDYAWTRDTMIYATGGLFQVHFVIYKETEPSSEMTILLWRPDSPNAGGGGVAQP